MKPLKLLVLTLTLVLCLSDSFASIRRYCKVRYQTTYGWSKEYTMEVEFATGTELNYRTNSYRYSAYATYALLWFSNGGVAIIKMSSSDPFVGDEYDRQDFLNTFMFRSEVDGYQVNDEYNTRWQIKAREYISFIDPREN